MLTSIAYEEYCRQLRSVCTEYRPVPRGKDATPRPPRAPRCEECNRPITGGNLGTLCEDCREWGDSR